MRSTADKTFFSSTGSKLVPTQHEERRTHNSEVITERFNYIEDSVPVEKEVVTKITRGRVGGQNQDKYIRTEDQASHIFSVNTEDMKVQERNTYESRQPIDSFRVNENSHNVHDHSKLTHLRPEGGHNTGVDRSSRKSRVRTTVDIEKSAKHEDVDIKEPAVQDDVRQQQIGQTTNYRSTYSSSNRQQSNQRTENATRNRPATEKVSTYSSATNLRRSTAGRSVQRSHSRGGHHLIEQLTDWIRHYRRLEQIRADLNINHDLNYSRLFDSADVSARGRVSVNEMREYLSSIGVYSPQDDIETLMSTYDVDKDGHLNFREFKSLFGSVLATAEKSHYGHQTSSSISLETRDIRQCLQDTLNLELEWSTVRRRLSGRLHQLFDMADSTTHRPTFSDYMKLFERHNFYASADEIRAVMTRLDSEAHEYKYVSATTTTRFVNESRFNAIDRQIELDRERDIIRQSRRRLELERERETLEVYKDQIRSRRAFERLGSNRELHIYRTVSDRFIEEPEVVSVARTYIEREPIVRTEIIRTEPVIFEQVIPTTRVYSSCCCGPCYSVDSYCTCTTTFVEPALKPEIVTERVYYDVRPSRPIRTEFMEEDVIRQTVVRSPRHGVVSDVTTESEVIETIYPYPARRHRFGDVRYDCGWYRD